MDDDVLEVNCGGCGRKLLLRICELYGRFTIDCEECERKRGSRVEELRRLVPTN